MNLKSRLASWGRKVLNRESGQVFAVTALGSLCLVGLAGIAVEVGHGYYALELLQASTDEATLAAAAGLPSSSQATTYAQDFSSLSNDQNQLQILQNVNLSVSPFCSTTVTSAYNVPCQSSNGGTAYNAVRVVQTATSGLWLGRLFNGPAFTLQAVGTAAMAGGPLTPYNIAIIMDTTGSMGSADPTTDCGTGSHTAEYCALLGLRTLLQDAYPCAAGQTCTQSGATPNDAIALYVFPTVTTATVSLDTSCPTSNPTVAKYTMPTTPSTDTTEIIPFSSGVTYRVSDTAASLNSGDSLVNAAGGPTDNCTGLRTPGGTHTYYAQAIYQAGQALAAEQTARPGSQNIMIFLSDGDANAGVTYTKTSGKNTGIDTSASDMIPSTQSASAGSLNGTSITAWNNANIYTFPSNVGQCGQAVQAMSDVATQTSVTFNPGNTGSVTYTLNNSGSLYTKVYTIAYNSEPTWAGAMSGGDGNCGYDKPYNSSSNAATSCTASQCTVNITTGSGSWPTPSSSEGSIAAYSPCAAIAAMASSPSYFFSDNASGSCPATTAPNQGITSLTAIFSDIIESLSSPKLIPNGTT
jgi:Flp pilus assembly protein TadG